MTPLTRRTPQIPRTTRCLTYSKIQTMIWLIRVTAHFRKDYAKPHTFSIGGNTFWSRRRQQGAATRRKGARWRLLGVGIWILWARFRRLRARDWPTSANTTCTNSSWKDFSFLEEMCRGSRYWTPMLSILWLRRASRSRWLGSCKVEAPLSIGSIIRICLYMNKWIWDRRIGGIIFRRSIYTTLGSACTSHGTCNYFWKSKPTSN